MLFYAEVTQLVEYQFSKLNVAGSSPVFRSNSRILGIVWPCGAVGVLVTLSR